MLGGKRSTGGESPDHHCGHVRSAWPASGAAGAMGAVGAASELGEAKRVKAKRVRTIFGGQRPNGSERGQTGQNDSRRPNGEAKRVRTILGGQTGQRPNVRTILGEPERDRSEMARPAAGSPPAGPVGSARVAPGPGRGPTWRPCARTRPTATAGPRRPDRPVQAVNGDAARFSPDPPIPKDVGGSSLAVRRVLHGSSNHDRDHGDDRRSLSNGDAGRVRRGRFL